MAKQITITVGDDGKLEIKTDGYRGEECAPDFEKLLKALEEEGLKVKSKDVKRKVDSAAAVRQGVSS